MAKYGPNKENGDKTRGKRRTTTNPHATPTALAQLTIDGVCALAAQKGFDINHMDDAAIEAAAPSNNPLSNTYQL